MKDSHLGPTRFFLLSNRCLVFISLVLVVLGSSPPKKCEKIILHAQEFINFKLLLHFHMKLSNILLAIPVAKFTHLQTFEYEIVNDIHNKNECGVGQ